MELSNIKECNNCGCMIDLDIDNYSWGDDGHCGDDNIICEDCANDLDDLFN